MSKNLVELKPLPCPFCGGKVSINYERTFYIECPKCIIRFMPCGVWDKESYCVDTWNRRVCENN